MDSEKGSRFTVIEYARLPHLPASPKPGRLLLMGFVGGIGVGVGLAFMLEEMDRSFKTLDEARESLPFAYLGVVSKMIPEAPPADSFSSHFKHAYENFMNKHQMLSHVRLVAPTPLKKTSPLPILPEVITVHQPQTMLMEEFRVIKSNIKNLTAKEGSVSIIVTSSLKGEGKSTSAANLAVVMAHGMKNALLVDADMRRGRLHELFGVRQGPGLTDVLNGTSTLDTAFVFSGVERLTLITRGQSSHNSFDLIDSSKAKSIIDELKRRFDIIIFDTPPVLSLPDTPLLSQLVDGVLLVVQAERTQKKDVINAQRALEQSHAKLLGFALTNVKYYIPRSLYQYYYYCENN
jgi:capsular exopolysaccharide synthesis family protein